MADPQVVSREEWLVARQALLAQEKELTRLRDAVNAERRRLPMVAVDKDYTFVGAGGSKSLADLFEGRRQLLVYHFMFGPDWDAGCESCSFIVDNIGDLSHLHARSTTLVTVSRAPIETLMDYKKRMGWSVPWYSSYGSEFNYDFHVTLDPEVAPVEYNYAAPPQDPDGSMEAHGISAFLREGDQVFHTYSSYARGGDILMGTYNWLDLTALGRQEDWEEPAGRADSPTAGWVRRHDEYGT
jgi:predicted dithiol-disulfide oxidoreductase (DUF899 family)